MRPAPRLPRVSRVIAAGPPAAVLVYVLAPDSLVGWPSPLSEEQRAWLDADVAGRPMVGRLSGRGSTLPLERLVALRPDLVLDVGDVGPTEQSLAERVRRQTGLRYELLAGSLADSPTLLRRAGALLGVADRAEELARAAEAILESVTGGTRPREGTRVYLARGTDGLETGLAGSINTEVIEYVGASNVAAAAGRGGLTRVSPEQVLSWNPDVIVTQDERVAALFAGDPRWRGVAAVRARRVLVAPRLPFGWIDAPPGVNRLVGVRWLAAVLTGEVSVAVLQAEVRDFYRRFYRLTLSDERLGHLLAGAL